MGGQTRYVGFYYIEADDVDVFMKEFPAHSFEYEMDGDSHTFKEKNGDNTLYLEKIMNGFYIHLYLKE